MSKYLVETFYTCTFKIVHKLNELNEKKLLELENRKDGEVEILDVRLNNRKTKTTNKKDEYQNPTDKIKLKKEHSISSLINEKISTSNPTKISNEADNNKLSVKKNNERSKMPDRRKGYIQKVSIGDQPIYLYNCF